MACLRESCPSDWLLRCCCSEPHPPIDGRKGEICTSSAWVFPDSLDGKECLQHGRPGFDPWVWRIPWRNKWHPTIVFLPGEFHGQGNLAGYSPWGHKEPGMTEQLITDTHTRVLQDMYILKKRKNLSASWLLRRWVLFTSNLAKTKRWSCGRSENTGESVLQGKVNTPATHLSKDTWQLTSGNTRTGWKEEKTIHFQILLGKVIWKPMSQKEQAYVNKRRNCILDSFIIAVYSNRHPQPPCSSEYLSLNIPGNKMN